MHKYIIASARGGLGNRIKCLVSSMRLAERQSKTLILFWPADDDCGCRFIDLFENKISQVTQDELERLIKKTDFSQSYRICETWRFLSLPQDALPKNFSRAYVSEEGNNIDFEYGRIPLSVRNDILKYLFRLTPNKYIVEKTDEFCGKFDNDTIAVNIRSWETEKRSALFDIRNVYKVMDRKRKGAFFIVCDSPAVLEQLKSRYGERALIYPRRTFPGDRKSVEGIQDALIELLLLAKNRTLIVSYLSTFSEMAWWFGACKAKVEKIPMTLTGRMSMVLEWIKIRIKKWKPATYQGIKR